MIFENLTDKPIVITADGEDYIIQPDDFTAVYCDNDTTISVEVYDGSNVAVRHEESYIRSEE